MMLGVRKVPSNRNGRSLMLSAATTLAAALSAVAIATASASAADTHDYLSQLTGFANPRSLAFDATGNLYVADSNNNTVDRLNTSGAPLDFAASEPYIEGSKLTGTPAGAFAGGLSSVAVNQETGEIYVAEKNTHVVDVFSASGEFQSQLTGTPTGAGGSLVPFGGPQGVAVDNAPSSLSHGDLYVAEGFESNGSVDMFSPTGTYLSRFGTGILGEGEKAIALDDTTEAAYVAVGSTESIDVFDSTGAFLTPEWLGHGTPYGSFDTGNLRVAVDQDTGRVYVTESNIPGSKHGVVDEFNASSTEEYVGQLTGTPAGSFNEVEAAAADPVNGDLYIATTTSGQGGVIDVFGPDILVPDTTTEAPTNVTKTAALLHGTVNPDGTEVTSCEFEWGSEAGVLPHTATCSPAPGSGSTPVAVSAEASLLPGHTYYYRLAAGNSEGSNHGSEEHFSTPPAVDALSTGPAEDVTGNGAKLTGSLSPDGADAHYYFQYGTSTFYGSTSPAPPGTDAGTASASVHAETTLTGLAGNTTYHYRLVGVNSFGTTYGQDETFQTGPTPSIQSASYANLTAASVELQASIDPNGSATTYRFEWGTSTAYGKSGPLPEGTIPASASVVPVTLHLSELSANVPYHWRVVASNAAGISVSPDHTFVYPTGTGASLPDGRAYEMVTPTFKDGALVNTGLIILPPSISEDGKRIILTSIQAFAGAQSAPAENGGSEGDPYEFTRTSTGGWVTTPLAPSAAQLEVNGDLATNANTGSALFYGQGQSGMPDNFYVGGADGSLLEVGPGGPASDPPGRGIGVALAATEDFSTFLYTLQGSEKWPFDGTLPTSAASLYEYSGTGDSQPSLVGVSGGAGSTELISVCGTETALGKTFGSISAEGNTAFFTALSCPDGGSGKSAGVTVPVNELYARVDGNLPDAHTVAISEPRAPASAAPDENCTTRECQQNIGVEANWRDAEFLQASSDGTKVFFETTQQLTDQASQDSDPSDTPHNNGCQQTVGTNGCNLYEYDFGAPAGHNLTAVSAGDTSGEGPQVQGVMAISPDGSHVYFVARGVLGAATNRQGQSAIAGADNLYLYERDVAYPSGHTVFIATLSPADSGEWANGASFGALRPNVTPEGRFLVFLSHGDLTADDTSQTGAAQVFRYDAQSEELVRISIGENGFNDDGNAGTGNANIAAPDGDIHFRLDPTMSNNGAYVFFESPVGLTPAALDDVRIGTEPSSVPPVPVYAENVYEYHEGQVYLISDGRDVTVEGEELSAVKLLGSDASGANVFFETADGLVAEDTNAERDVYDARICTAAEPCPATTTVLPPCGGEACHGTPAATPSLLTPGSETFNGSGNLVPNTATKSAKKTVKCKKGKRLRHDKCVRAKRKTKNKKKKTGRSFAKKTSHKQGD